jgi:hypothetical protein
VSSIAGLTDRGTVAAYVCVDTTRLSGRNYTTSRDATLQAGPLQTGTLTVTVTWTPCPLSQSA